MRAFHQKIVFVIVPIVFSLLNINSTFADPDSLSPAQKEFVESYVKAVNAKDEAQLKKLMHPKYLECRNDSNSDYFAELTDKDFKFTIPKDFKAKIEPLSAENIKKEIEGAKQFDIT